MEIGTIIVYGTEGVCKVTDIQKMSFSALDEPKDYYILVPEANSSSKLYLPKDNEMLMARVKKLLTYKEVKDLIASKNNSIEWIEDSKLRNKYYKEILASCDRNKIFAIAKQLYLVKTGKINAAKTFTSWMEDMLKKTAQILYQEFSYVAEVSYDEILPFIAGEIDCPEKK